MSASSQDQAAGREAATTDGTVPGGTAPEVTGAPGPGPAPANRSFLQRSLPRHGLLVLAAFVGVVLLVELAGPFRDTQILRMAALVPALAGLTVLTGINGQISLGHGALMAVGAYTTALIYEQYENASFVLAVVAAVVVTTLVGVLVGAAAARLHGPYLAGATLAFAVGLPDLARRFEFLGGEQGLRVPRPVPPEGVEQAYASVFGDMSRDTYTAVLFWLLALVVLFLLSNLITSRVGRDWRAVRDDEVAAQLAGINLTRTRILAFAVSAAAAGVAGAMVGSATRLATPSSFTLVLSISLLAAIVVGGLGSLVGSLLGAAMLVFLPQGVAQLGVDAGLSDLQAANLSPLVYGAVLVLVMLVAPFGVVGTLRRRVLERQARKRIAAASSGT